MRKYTHNVPLLVLNLLVNTDDYLDTYQMIARSVGCDRKSVYSAMDVLEVHGFGIGVVKRENKQPNLYKSRLVTLEKIE